MEVLQLDGLFGTTVTKASTDAAQNLFTSVGLSKTNTTGKRMIGVLITCETNDVRFTFTATPTTALGHVLYAGMGIVLTEPVSMANFKFLSAVAGTHGVLMITPIYNPN